MQMSVTPAYGRDYKSAAAAIADLKAGKDFLTGGPGRALPINLAQLREFNYSIVNIRYASLRRVAVVDLATI